MEKKEPEEISELKLDLALEELKEILAPERWEEFKCKLTKRKDDEALFFSIDDFFAKGEHLDIRIFKPEGELFDRLCYARDVPKEKSSYELGCFTLRPFIME